MKNLPNIKKLILLTIIILINLLLIHAHAQAFCFAEAGSQYNISPQLLWSIAKVESNFQPQVVNWNRNGSYDYGVMQINSAWRSKLGEERWNMLGDPCMNVKVGAWVLAQCIARHGYNWKAVGCYNAASRYKGDVYARKVHSVLARYFNTNKNNAKTSQLAMNSN